MSEGEEDPENSEKAKNSSAPWMISIRTGGGLQRGRRAIKGT